MQINKDQSMQGFIVKNISNLAEMDAVFYEMEHIKTGAKLGWMKNGDENKTFSITFRTIPWDDTGVFHILEHCLLQGSTGYPVKAPFVHLMKSSMNTFLNAMTFQDKTMFPVASRNKVDFENLIRVYMDAVLHPLIYENENIFLQEGWHVEFEEDDLSYNGVVFNEMKGDHSSVDSLLYTQIIKGLFPENGYGFESGGDPAEIPNLTYENFCRTHKLYYHPSNSIILLDGDVDIESILRILDQEYLADYGKNEEQISFSLQKPCSVKGEATFAAEDETGYLGLGFVLGQYSDLKEIYAAKILADYLVEGNEAPLKRAILENQLGYDVTAMISDDVLQPFLLLTVRNIDPALGNKIEKVFEKTLEDILVKGMDEKQLEALICRYEFETVERDFEGEPAGLMNAITCLNSWLYGGNPVSGFETESIFAALRKEVADGTFSNYINQFFLRNPHKASILMRPDENYLETEEEAERSRLQKFYGGLSESARADLKAKDEILKNWQKEIDTPDVLACMPKLNLADISDEPLEIPCEILPDDTIYHCINTRGINYLRLYFPIDEALESDLAAIAFLGDLYGELPLFDTDAWELAGQKARLFGQFRTYLEVYPRLDTQDATAYFCLDVSFLQKNEKEALELALKIIEQTNLDDVETIERILYQECENAGQEMIVSGHSMAMLQAKATLSKEAYLKNLSEGPAYVNWLEAMTEDVENNLSALTEKMKYLAKNILSAKSVKVSLTTDAKYLEYARNIKESLGSPDYLVDKESAGNCKKATVADQDLITIPAPVAYSAMALSMKDFSVENSGGWSVLAKLLSMDYLWNEIRVLGGAYGTGMSVDVNGIVGFYSYRDPSPEKSIDTYSRCSKFIQNADSKDIDLSGIKIGAIADTEPVMAAGALGKVSDSWYFAGISDRYRKERRKQILSTTYEDLLSMAEELERMNAGAKSCIVAAGDEMGDDED